MSKVLTAHAVSVDGYIRGRTPDGTEEFGRGLGDAPMLFEHSSHFGGGSPQPTAPLFVLTSALEASLVDEVVR